MTNKIMRDKLKKYLSDQPSRWIELADKYERDKYWLNKSALIAINILRTLRSQSMTQKKLAESIGVTPQYINKVVKGFENLSLETIGKIERSLGITLVSVPSYEKVQIINDRFSECTPVISRYASKLVGSEKSEYKAASNYQPEEELIAA
jgi:transcriptional regulator with XRE-family HTH domain